MSNQRIIGEIEEDVSILDGLNFEWRISNFLDLSNEVFDCYESPRISFCDVRWYFKVFQCTNPSEPFRLSLEHEGQEHKILKIKVGIKTSDGFQQRRGEVLLQYGHCYWNNFCTRAELTEQKQTLMPNDGLTIMCMMKMYNDDDDDDDDWESITWSSDENEGSEYNDEMYEYESDDYDEDDDEYEASEEDYENEDEDLTWRDYYKQQIRAESAKKRIETLAKDFGKLLSNSEDCNVIVQVGDVELKAHRSILMARSPVLSAMFGHNTAESASMKISICDCRPEVFRQYLHYIYTGSAETLTEDNVFDLYRVADKYLAEDLKEQCLMHIVDTLSLQTFCEAVKMALTYGESSLLEQVTSFAMKNVSSIKSSIQWQDFESEYPAEAKEAIVRFLGEDENS